MYWTLRARGRVELGARSAPQNIDPTPTHLRWLVSARDPTKYPLLENEGSARHWERPGNLCAGQRKGKVAEKLYVLILLVKWLLSQHVSVSTFTVLCNKGYGAACVNPTCRESLGQKPDVSATEKWNASLCAKGASYRQQIIWRDRITGSFRLEKTIKIVESNH